MCCEFFRFCGASAKLRTHRFTEIPEQKRAKLITLLKNPPTWIFLHLSIHCSCQCQFGKNKKTTASIRTASYFYSSLENTATATAPLFGESVLMEKFGPFPCHALGQPGLTLPPRLSSLASPEPETWSTWRILSLLALWWDDLEDLF